MVCASSDDAQKDHAEARRAHAGDRERKTEQESEHDGADGEHHVLAEIIGQARERIGDVGIEPRAHLAGSAARAATRSA